jgi:GMP synthase (glutamine-hydrolysing)
MTPPRRLLVLDAYAEEGREALRACGATEAGLLYVRVIERLAPTARVDVAHPADGPLRLPPSTSLRDYDGVVWTGSSLTIHREGDPRVERQIDVVRECFESGVPAFGSCWAAQLACVAAGGRAEANPKGREFGLARGIALCEAGRAHPLLAGRPPVFDALASHADHVTRLPAGGIRLASNDMSDVQALDVSSGRSRFWAVQYHPEYDLHEVAALARLRADELVAQGSFEDRAALDAWADDLEALHADPDRRDLARRRGVGPDVLDPDLRQREVRNWLESLDP